MRSSTCLPNVSGAFSRASSWLIWAAILFFLGMRHPSIHDASKLGPGRRRLGALALVIAVTLLLLP